MGVERAVPARVFHDDDLAVSTHATALDDTAGLGGEDRRAPLGGDVESLMRTAPSHPESRAQAPAHGPCELKRRLDFRGFAGSTARFFSVATRRSCSAASIGLAGSCEEAFASTRDIESLARAQLRDVADAVGLGDFFGGYFVAEADSVEVFALLDVMNHAGAAWTSSRTTRQSGEQNECKRECKPSAPPDSSGTPDRPNTPIAAVLRRSPNGVLFQSRAHELTHRRPCGGRCAQRIS